MLFRSLTGADVIGGDGDRDAVFFTSLDNILRAVNRGNGNQRWIGRVATRPALPPRLVSSPQTAVYDPVVLVTGVTPDLQTFNAKTGEPLGMYTAPSELQGGLLVDPQLRPYQVAAVAVTRNGQVVGLRPTAMLLAEPTLTPPSSGLPGRPQIGRAHV